MSHCCKTNGLSRRAVLVAGLGALVLPIVGSGLASAASLPSEVAGVKIPQSSTAQGAAAFARQSCPEFLFNHSMRTFLFGALFAKKQNMPYDADEAFVAASLHDLGLLSSFASASESFEIDGAHHAEKFALDAGFTVTQADRIWHSVAFHDERWTITKRAGPEAMLVSAGAGSDVVGPDTNSVDAKQLAEVLTAFPRLQFKRQFTALLINHCKRKPQSQSGTWLESLCREQVPGVSESTIEQKIAAAGFSE